MNRRRLDAIAVQLLGQSIGAVLGAPENQYLLPVVGSDQKRQQLALAILIDRVDDLLDHFDRGVAACHFDQCRRL